MKVTQTRVPRSLRVFLPMDITEQIISFDGLVQSIRPGMTAHEVECLQREFTNVTIDFLLEASKQHPNLKDYVNVCGRKENKEES